METLPAIINMGAIKEMAQIFIQSGYFKEVKDLAQACVKIMAGAEMGISPIAAMRGVDIVQGQISVRAHLMGAMIKRSGRYNYAVVEHTAEVCKIDFYDNEIEVGASEFSMDDAKLAGLAGKETWKKFPKAMLYNRAMSQGARMYCPDIFLGAIYDEGEIEAKPEQQVGQSRKAFEVTDESFWTDNPVQAVPLEDEPDDIPEADQAPPEPATPATPNQMKFLYSLLSQRGVLEGDAHNLVARVYPEGVPKSKASNHLEELKYDKNLSSFWMAHYVAMLRDQAGVDKETVIDYLETWFGRRTPVGLIEAEQTQLIEWLTEGRSNAKPDWETWVANIAERTGSSTTDIEAWIIDAYGRDSDQFLADMDHSVFTRVSGMEAYKVQKEVELYVQSLEA